jgi:UDP-2,4-diacetamido-2,4,6-trideoxy-beta-L-altropyranose hydrolase
MSDYTKTVLFRADSSSEIGTGHIMRDLVLAQRDYGDDRVIFATQNLSGNINHRIQEKGLKIYTLRSNNIADLLEAIKSLDVDTLVIDHYAIDLNDEQSIKQHYPNLKLVVFDDTYNAHHCDVLINHNIYADVDRYKGLVPKTCELRCGKKYLLLRKEFYEAVRSDPILPTVLVAMGGSDPLELNIPIVNILLQQNIPHINVVTTTANPNLPQLQAFAEQHPSIALHINTQNMAHLMAQASFAIVAPSVTLNEIMFLGVPFIAIQTAENQKEMVKFLKEKSFPILENFSEKALFEEIKSIIEKNTQ